MTYATDTDKLTGEEPIILVEAVEGSTTYYWSTKPIADDTNNRFYEPIILSAGVLDRGMSGSAPGGTDVVMRLDGKDGGLDSLFSAFTGAGTNIIETDVTIKRGFQSLAIANFQNVAVLQFARLIGVDDNRVFTVEFRDETADLFGTITPPTIKEVLLGLEVADGTTYDLTPASQSATGVHDIDEEIAKNRVPVAHGRWFMNGDRSTDGVIGAIGSVAGTGLFAYHNGSLGGGINRTAPFSIVAVSAYNMDAYPVRYRGLGRDGQVNPNSTATEYTSSAQSFGADAVSVTVNGIAMFAYVVKGIPNMISSFRGHGHTSSEKFNPRPGALIEGLAKMGGDDSGNKTSWANGANTTSFTDLDARLSGLHGRLIVTEPVRVMEVIGQVADSFKIETFINRSGKLQAFFLEPEGGPSQTYASVLNYTEDNDILSGSMSAMLPEDGQRHGMINSVTVSYFLTGIRHHENYLGVSLAFNLSEAKEWTHQNDTSISRHKRVSHSKMGSTIIAHDTTARRVGERILSLYDDPRFLVTFSTMLRGTQLELGEIVAITHTAVPGWGADRLCIVDQIVEDLDEYTTTITVVDYDDALTAKAFVYSTVALTDVKTGTSSNKANLTNGSSTVTFNGASPSVTGANVGDIFSAEGWGGAPNTLTNRLNGIITAVDTGTPTLTLSDAGGLDGPQNSTYTTETDMVNWKVFASQATRTTGSRGDYSSAIADDRGAYADDADDLFRDDTTIPYVYRRPG